MSEPIWANAVNEPDESDFTGLEETDNEYHIVLTKKIAHGLIVLAAVGVGAISYVLGKGIERVLDK